QDEQCAVYLKRLQILDKSARTDAQPAPPKTPSPAAPAAAPSEAAEKVARGVRAEDDPLQQTPRRATPTGRTLLSEAEKAFAEKHYREADELFARAYGSDAVAPNHAPQWAYAKMHSVVGRLQEAEASNSPAPAAELEREMTQALRLAAGNAELDAYGHKLLDAVRQRAAGPAAA